MRTPPKKSQDWKFMKDFEGDVQTSKGWLISIQPVTFRIRQPARHARYERISTDRYRPFDTKRMHNVWLQQGSNKDRWQWD